MNKRLFSPLVIIPLVLALTTGCTSGKEEVYPTQVATTDASPSEPEDEVVTQTPAPSASPQLPKPNVTLDASQFVAKAIKGTEQADIDEILEVAHNFAVQGYNPDFLNGTWTQKTMSDIAAGFSSYVSEPVALALESIDPTDPESAMSLSSIAALFTPTKKIKATEECLQAVSPTGCLYIDLVLSEPKVALVDKQIEVTFSASSQRYLLLEGEPATSDVIINHTLYFSHDDDDRGWLINGINNTFEYGIVKTLD